jgi:uncharacterized protein
MRSRIYEGRVRHRRESPRPHEFDYRLYMMYLDLAELDEVFRGRWLWSAHGPNLAWFRRSDHFGDPCRDLDSSVRSLVEQKIGRIPRGPVCLLTHLRYFGYCMNPVSFYYCWKEDGAELDAIVAEVHNTPWGETHCYVLDAGRGPCHGFSKAFHVSPFMGMNQRYEWRLAPPGEVLTVSMQNFENGRRVFNAAMSLRAQPVTGPAMARVLVRYPAMTIRVIGAIYWQALRLGLKGIPFHSHPKLYRPRQLER